MYLGFFAMCVHAAHIQLKKYGTDVLQVISVLLHPNIQQTRIVLAKFTSLYKTETEVAILQDINF